MHEWNDLYVAVAGAAAALTGLLFVGISINLEKILSAPILATRATVPLISLVAILILSVFVLIPKQTLIAMGYETITLGLVVWVMVTTADAKIYKQSTKEYKKQSLLYLLFDQVVILPYIIAGIVVLFNGEMGMYWIIPGVGLSFIKSVSDAWILLIEIKR